MSTTMLIISKAISGPSSPSTLQILKIRRLLSQTSGFAWLLFAQLLIFIITNLTHLLDGSTKFNTSTQPGIKTVRISKSILLVPSKDVAHLLAIGPLGLISLGRT